MNNMNDIRTSTGDEKLLFMKQALVDIYSLRSHRQLGEVFGDIVDSSITIQQFEYNICQYFRIRFLNFSEKLNPYSSSQSIRWKCQILCNDQDPFDANYIIRFLPPDIDASTSLFLHSFGDDRFLFVTIVGIYMKDSQKNINDQFYNQHWAEMALFRNGITFADQKYFFLGAEESERKAIAKIVENPSKRKKQKGLSAWFFNERPPGTTAKQVIPIPWIRDYLGHLTQEKPGKCNARLKLGFSNIFLLDGVHENQLLIKDDVPNPIHPSKVMTDGCGLISLSLARLIPYGIMQGIVQRDRDAKMPVAVMLQIRCVCAQGLFKGCLLVTSDENLCPAGCVVFRPSMQKSDSSPSYSNSSTRKPLFGIVRSFESPSLLKSPKKQDKSDYSVRLNQQTCLLLHYLKIPYEYFEDLMKKELLTLMNCLRTTEDAKKLVKQVLKSTNQQATSSDGGIVVDEEEFFEDLTEESDLTIMLDNDNQDEMSVLSGFPFDDDGKEFMFDQLPEKNSNNRVILEDDGGFYDDIMNQKASSTIRRNDDRSSSAELVRLLLMAGFSLQESFVRQEFDKIIEFRYKHLIECRLQIRNSLYLVGAPDPYGFLEPNEVFISFPNDRQDITNVSFLDCKTLKGKVLVTRHPTSYPGDLRLFTAVSHPLLEKNSISSSNGGVIVFSTKGDRAPADQMSGGDYDGDLFLISYNDESGFLDYFEPVPPLVEEEEPAESVSYHAITEYGCPHAIGECRECWDILGVSILRSLLLTTQKQNIGRYSIAWQRYADVDPMSKEALECARISRIALDAAKTGKKIPENAILLSDAPLPHYLETIKDSKYQYYQHGVSKNKNMNQNNLTGSQNDDDLFEEEFEAGFVPIPNTIPLSQVTNQFDSMGLNKNTGNSPMGNKLSSNSRKSSSMGKSYHSNSVIGRLYDLTQRIRSEFDEASAALYELPQQSNNNPREMTEQPIYFDFDCAVVVELDFNPLYQQSAQSSAYSSKELEKIQQFLIPKEILKKYCSFNTKYFTLQKTTEFQDRLYELFPHWIELFNYYFIQIKEFNMKLKELLDNRRNFNKFEKNKIIDELRETHYQSFLQKVTEYSEIFPMIPSKLIRLRIAGIIYLSTYLSIKPSQSGRNKSRKENHPLSYCWNLYSKELIYNKHQVSLKRQQLSMFELISPKEINFWL
jgi:hypothetical protein